MDVADGKQARPARPSESTAGAEGVLVKETQTHGAQQEGLDSTGEGKKRPDREGGGCHPGNETLLPAAPGISADTRCQLDVPRASLREAKHLLRPSTTHRHCKCTHRHRCRCEQAPGRKPRAQSERVAKTAICLAPGVSRVLSLLPCVHLRPGTGSAALALCPLNQS